MAADDVDLEVKGGSADSEAQLKQYEDISADIEAIKRNVDKIHALKAKDNKAADEQARQLIVKELERCMADTSGRARDIKDKLETLKDENKNFEADEDNRGSARAQVRQNLYNAHVRRFQAIMTAYNTAREDFKSNLQDRLVRQLRIVDANRTPEEISQLVESGQAQDIIKQALVSDSLRDTVEDLRDRNAELMKIQRSVQELFELFKDLHTLVELQGETLNVIENRISSARDYVEKGKENVHVAADYQLKARKRKCCLLMIVLIILLAVLLPTLLSKFSSG